MRNHLAATSGNPSVGAAGATPEPDRRRLRFGDFELVAESCELLRRDPRGASRPVRLQPQPARALLYLAERAGSLVTRAELQHHLWGENHFVDFEQGLNYCIRAIRRALGEDASSPRFLETVPRRGYRFRSRVEVHEPAPRRQFPRRHSGSASDLLPRRGQPGALPQRTVDRRTAITVIAIAALSLALHWALSAGLLEPFQPPKLAVLPFDDHTNTPFGSALAGSLSDELISNLASSYPERLGVIARASSFAYAGRGLTAAQLGSELDADYLLTGGLQISGNATRVTVQLIRVRDQTNLWAEIYDWPADPADRQDWVSTVSVEVANRLALSST